VACAAAVLMLGCGGSTWENYLEDHEVEAEGHKPADALEVLALVQSAAAEGRRIRAVGAGHSSSEVAQPSPGHDFVDVSDIDEEMPWGFYRDHAERYVRIGAGARISEINQHLAERDPPRFKDRSTPSFTVHTAGGFSFHFSARSAGVLKSSENTTLPAGGGAGAACIPRRARITHAVIYRIRIGLFPCVLTLRLVSPPVGIHAKPANPLLRVVTRARKCAARRMSWRLSWITHALS